MKTVLLSLFALTMAHLSFAQINQGALLVGAGFNFLHFNDVRENQINSQSLTSESNTTNFSFFPSVGYFVKPNLMVGLGLGYQLSNQVSSNSQTDDELAFNRHTFSISPYVKKYMELNDNLYFNIHVGVLGGFGWMNENYNGTESKSDFYQLRAAVSPGLTYFLNQKWALFANYGSIFYQFEHKIDYQNNSSDIASTTNSNYFAASFSLNSFSLGIQYFLRNE